MKYRIFLSIILICTMLAINGCSEEMRGQFGTMFEIRDKLIKKYNHENISINISNGTALGINFVNSRFNDLEEKEMENKAHEIALFTVSALKEKSGIESIGVVFTVNEQKYLIVNYTNTLNASYFDVSQLRKELSKKESDKSRQPGAAKLRG